MRPLRLDLAAFTGWPFPVCRLSALLRAGRLGSEGMGEKLVACWNGGDPRVYVDACAHLGLPLSLGRVEGGALRCAYHGWAYSTDDGALVEAPTVVHPPRCSLRSLRCLSRGDLLFAWTGDADAHAAGALLPDTIPNDAQIHAVDFDAPFPLALWNAVDYAHFPRHTGYSAIYGIYRALRRDLHVPGEPFHWEAGDAGPHRLRFTIPEARRTLTLRPTSAEFEDDGGWNRFQTFVTPLSETRTRYWEVYSTRSENPVLRAAGRAMFRAAIVPLLDREDAAWTAATSEPFRRGHAMLTDSDLPLAAYLNRFVHPRAHAS